MQIRLNSRFNGLSFKLLQTGFGLPVSSDKKFEKCVENWLRDDPSWIKYRAALTKSYFHNKVRVKPLKVLVWPTRPALLSSPPLIAAFGYEVVSVTVGLSVAAALFVGHLVVGGLETWAERKSGLVDANEEEIAIRVGDLVSSIRSDKTRAEDKHSSIVASLGIIEGYARLLTKSTKGQISVSLALYTGTGESEMKLAFRHPGSERPVNRRFRVKNVLGHYATQAGNAPRIVNNLKSFGKNALASPTRTTSSYRSILFFPINVDQVSGKKGFISIDCTKKYAFFGTVAERIVFMCQPLVAHIEDQL